MKRNTLPLITTASKQNTEAQEYHKPLAAVSATRASKGLYRASLFLLFLFLPLSPSLSLLTCNSSTQFAPEGARIYV